MRKIKFRVWDRATKKMHICGEDQHDSFYIHEDCTVSYYNQQNGCGSADGDDDAPNDDGYNLMQYTGLKDKNKVDIYEGDLLRDSDGYVLEVRWQSFSASWELSGRRSHFLFAQRCIDLLEIVGNIHENPELLAR
jgi:uncharacterized phage protein (TIGR01671 family)